MTPFTSLDGSYSINFPSTWTPTAQDMRALFSSQSDYAMMALEISTTHVALSGYDAYFGNFLTQINATNTQFDAPAVKTLPSGSWNFIHGTGKLDGMDTTFNIMGTDNGSATYFIYMVAPTATITDISSADFLPMLQSFTFSK